MVSQLKMPPELEFAQAPSFVGLTPEEEAELAQLESEFGGEQEQVTVSNLTPDEELELQQLEAEEAGLQPTETPSGFDILSAGFSSPQGREAMGNAISNVGEQAITGIGKGARALGQGALGVADLAALPFQAGMNQVGLNPQLPSEFFTQRVDEATGGALKPANMAERFLEQGGQFIGGAGAVNKLVKNGAMAENLVTKAKDVVPLIGSAFGSQAAEEMGGGAGAQLAGGALGAALPSGLAALARNTAGGASTMKQGFVGKTIEEIDDVAAKLNQKASGTYAKMREAGIAIKPQSTAKIIGKIESNVIDKGFIPELNPRTTAIINSMKKNVAEGDLSLDQLDQYRKVLSRTTMGSADPEDVLSAQKAIQAIDDSISGLRSRDLSKGDIKSAGLLRQARSEYSKFAKYDKISNILRRADGDPNKIKSGLTSFVNNKKNLRGFDISEIQAIRNAANSTNAEGFLKGLGRFGFEPKNVFMPTVGLGVAVGAGGGVPAAILAGTGTAARQGAKFMARGKAEQLLNTLEKGAKPLAKRTKSNIAPAANQLLIQGQ